MRTVMTRVFPDPAPARISSGPSVASTASRCRSLSVESKSVISSKFQIPSCKLKVNGVPSILQPATRNFELLYQLLYGLELFVARVAHQLEERELGGGGNRAGAHHLLDADLPVSLRA